MTPACVNIGWCDVVQALVVTLMIVLANEGSDVRFEVTGQEVVLQQDAVFQRLMPSLDLALCLRMIGRAACVRHAFVFQIFSEISGDIARAII